MQRISVNGKEHQLHVAEISQQIIANKVGIALAKFDSQTLPATAHNNTITSTRVTTTAKGHCQNKQILATLFQNVFYDFPTNIQIVKISAFLLSFHRKSALNYFRYESQKSASTSWGRPQVGRKLTLQGWPQKLWRDAS